MTYYVKIVCEQGEQVVAFDNKHKAIEYYDKMCTIKDIDNYLFQISVEYGEAKLFPIFKTQEKIIMKHKNSLFNPKSVKCDTKVNKSIKSKAVRVSCIKGAK